MNCSSSKCLWLGMGEHVFCRVASRNLGQVRNSRKSKLAASSEGLQVVSKTKLLVNTRVRIKKNRLFWLRFRKRTGHFCLSFGFSYIWSQLFGTAKSSFTEEGGLSRQLVAGHWKGALAGVFDDQKIKVTIFVNLIRFALPNPKIYRWANSLAGNLAPFEFL